MPIPSLLGGGPGQRSLECSTLPLLELREAAGFCSVHLFDLDVIIGPCYGLDVCVPPKLLRQSPSLSVVMSGGEAFGR